MIKATLLALGLLLSFPGNSFASETVETKKADAVTSVEVKIDESQEEWNPYDPQAEELLNQFDEAYEKETGKPAWLPNIITWGTGCKREACPVWIQISKSTQKAYLYRNGVHTDTWLVSTGVSGHSTINFDGHPNGRIYDRYNSKKFPGGDYKGLGNMPYAVFFKGGFAVHGTTQGNFKHLGKRASHGCVRMHPDHGRIFNRLVRDQGIYNVWITVQP